MKIKVSFAPAFLEGHLDGEDFRDVPNLTEDDMLNLSIFTDAVEEGRPLLGKNKPSWLDDDQNILPFTQTYQEDGYWHYHCVKLDDKRKATSFTYDLGLNLKGLTAAQVIHYTKDSPDSITVAGYSPSHIPFPPSDHPHKNNPLFVDVEE